MTTIRERIRQLRLAKGQGQAELAEGICKSSQFTLAKVLVSSGQYQAAIPLLNELMEGTGPDVPTEEVQYHLAISYAKTNQYGDALKLLGELEKSALCSDNRPLLCRASLALALVYLAEENYPVALYHLTSALEGYENLHVKDPHLYTQIMMGFADVYQQTGQSQLAYRQYNHLLTHQAAFLEQHEKAALHLTLAQQYQQTGNTQLSYKHAAHSHHLYETLKDRENDSFCRCKMLALSVDESNWQQQVERMLEMAFEYEDRSNRERAGEVFVELATICLRYADLERARDFANDALGQLPDQHPAREQAIALLEQNKLIQLRESGDQDDFATC